MLKREEMGGEKRGEGREKVLNREGKGGGKSVKKRK